MDDNVTGAGASSHGFQCGFRLNSPYTEAAHHPIPPVVLLPDRASDLYLKTWPSSVGPLPLAPFLWPSSFGLLSSVTWWCPLISVHSSMTRVLPSQVSSDFPCLLFYLLYLLPLVLHSICKKNRCKSIRAFLDYAFPVGFRPSLTQPESGYLVPTS